jgi:hypothetical protein
MNKARKYHQSEKGRATVWRYRSLRRVKDKINQNNKRPARKFAVWEAHLHSKYDLWGIEWAYMFRDQGYCCVGCGRTDPGTKRWWHTHHTGSKQKGTLKVHGILCHDCNIEAGSGTAEHILHLRILADKLEEWL